MKKHFQFIILSALLSGLFLVVSPIQAQEEQEVKEFKTIFDNNQPTRISGFGGPFIEFSGIGGEFAVSNGGGGAVLINNFFFGGYGIGLSTNHYTNLVIDDPASSSSYPYDYSNDRINFGHGGFWLGGIVSPNDAIHFSASTKLGWGGISLTEDYNNNHTGSIYYVNDEVFVILPQAEVEVNFTRWFKVNVGVGYRIVTGVNEQYYDLNHSSSTQGVWKDYFDKSDFNSFTGTISFLFGGF